MTSVPLINRSIWLDDIEFGARARLGLIMPSSGWTPEHEWPRMMPKGVSYHVARMPLLQVTIEALGRMGEHAVSAASMLATAKVNVIGYGCTSQTFVKGMEYDAQLRETIARRTGIEVVTMAGALVEALRAFGARNVAMVTPYTKDIAHRETDFMSSLGFRVLHEESLGIAETSDIAKVSPETVFEMGVRALKAAPSMDALLISCGNLRTLEVIPALEARLGKPVTSSNQALFWKMVRVSGVPDSLQEFGRLLA